MAEVKTEQEPSIEEILESIRQIISEDTEAEVKPVAAEKPFSVVQPASPPPVAPAAQPVAAAPAAVQPPPLDLTEKVEAPAPVVDLAPKPQPKQPDPQPSSVTIEMMDRPMAEETTNALMSTETANAVTESLSKLLASNVTVENEVGKPGKVTLEDMVRDMMKPMIKTWLDQNLPGIIEKVVQKEVEKLSRRAMDR
jgi:cell pole-organizing protein PopZ